MAKRFTDTEKWKKGFIRGLPPSYKLLWLYILDECDHAGIWHKEIEIASIRIGVDLDESTAIKEFSDHIKEFDEGEKWFIPDFIDFQYGVLNSDNRAHNSVIKKLKKYDLLDKNHKPLTSPLQGASNRAMDKDKDKDMDKEGDHKGEKYSIDCDEKWNGDQPIDYKKFVDVFNTLYDQSLRVTDQKRKNIRSRLGTFTGKQILDAWQSRKKDDWLTTDGKKFLGDWKAAMRNDEKVDRYLNAEKSSGLYDNNIRRGGVI